MPINIKRMLPLTFPSPQTSTLVLPPRIRDILALAPQLLLDIQQAVQPRHVLAAGWRAGFDGAGAEADA